MDPNGLVGKVGHVVTLQDDRMRDEIRRMAPQAESNPSQRGPEHSRSRNEPEPDLQVRAPLLHSGSENKE